MKSGYPTAHPPIACYIIIRRDNKVAFLLRSNTDWMSGYYGLPSGKVEKNESYSAAAIREAKEELDIDIAKANMRHALTVHRYDPSVQADDWVDVYFEASHWRGQPRNAEPDVHSKLAWLDPDNLPDNVVPSVKAALVSIADGQEYSEYGWAGKGKGEDR